MNQAHMDIANQAKAIAIDSSVGSEGLKTTSLFMWQLIQ